MEQSEFATVLPRPTGRVRLVGPISAPSWSPRAADSNGPTGQVPEQYAATKRLQARPADRSLLPERDPYHPDLLGRPGPEGTQIDSVTTGGPGVLVFSAEQQAPTAIVLLTEGAGAPAAAGETRVLPDGAAGDELAIQTLDAEAGAAKRAGGAAAEGEPNAAADEPAAAAVIRKEHNDGSKP